jgi:hypothetical protein
MSDELNALVTLLKSNPGYVYVNPEGTHMFALVGPEKKLTVFASRIDLSEKSQPELETILVRILRNA